MVCPVCKIEMTRKSATEWVCRNPRCVKYGGNKAGGGEPNADKHPS